MRRSKGMRQMRKRRGFTLTELLISILITGIVMSAVLTLFFSVFKSYEFHQDIMEAKQRGQIALAAIEPLVLNAALGMPVSTSDFQSAFSGLNILFPDDADKQFAGPVQLADDSGKRKTVPDVSGAYKDKITGSQLWVVYGVPSGYGNSNNGITEFNQGDQEDIVLAPDTFDSLKNGLSNVVNNFKSWITFPGNKYPLLITSDPGDLSSVNNKLKVKSFKKQSVFRNDELLYVRAAKIKANNGNLHIAFLMETSEVFQPVVEGIFGLQSVYDPEGSRVLTVTVLARADTMRSELNTTSVDGWTGIIPNNKYRYAAVSKSWRIRN